MNDDYVCDVALLPIHVHAKDEEQMEAFFEALHARLPDVIEEVAAKFEGLVLPDKATKEDEDGIVDIDQLG